MLNVIWYLATATDLKHKFDAYVVMSTRKEKK